MKKQKKMFFIVLGIVFYILFSLFSTVPTHAGFHYDPDKEEVWILSCDGGGVRGVIPARILVEIEKELNSLYQRHEEKDKFRIGKLFDLVSGTSTGGIIALGVTSTVKEGGRSFQAQELLDLYQDNGDKIFPPPGFIYGKLPDLVKGSTGPRYDSSGLEAVLAHEFGTSELKDANPQVLISSYDLRARVPYWFDSLRAMSHSEENYPVQKVARATSAAPTYFKAARTTGVSGEERVLADGGLTHNNPTWKAFQDAQRLYKKAKKFFILSLGTGEAPVESLEGREESGTLEWATGIAGVMMGGASDEVHQSILNQKSILEELGIKVEYHRIQPVLHPDLLKMDDPTRISHLISAVHNLLSRSNPLLNVLERMEERIKTQTGENPLRNLQDTRYGQLRRHIETAGRLKEIDLSEEEIDDDALTWVRRKLNETYPQSEGIEIKRLDLSRNKLSVDGLKGILDLVEAYPTIDVVRLDHSETAGDKGVVRLCTLLESFPRRIQVSVEGVGLSKKGLSHLETLIEMKSRVDVHLEIWLGENEDLKNSLSTNYRNTLSPNIHFASLPRQQVPEEASKSSLEEKKS